MRKIMGMIGALGLAACQETQTAPDLPQIASTEFEVEVIAEGLKNPWAVAQIPETAFLITEIGGRLNLHSGGRMSEVSGLPNDIFVGGQGGLLDVVLAPDFFPSGEIFISYAYGTQDANGTALIKAKLESDGIGTGHRLTNVIEIFRADPPKAAASHFGGRITFLPDDTLVLTLGDGFAYREDAQKPDTHLGKLVRLNRDGSVPEDNPFLGTDFKPETYSIGHRNVQGLAYDAQTDTLWEHEHGPRGGDELNRIEPSANYGWPIATTGTDYQGARITPFESYEGMTGFVHDWTPSIAPSGLAIYRGDLFPDWDGDALVGGLASRDLRRLDLQDGEVVGEYDLLSDLNARIRDVRVAQDGSVLVLTDDPDNGQLLRLRPK